MAGGGAVGGGKFNCPCFSGANRKLPVDSLGLFREAAASFAPHDGFWRASEVAFSD
jgi:hypothetical protein